MSDLYSRKTAIGLCKCEYFIIDVVILSASDLWDFYQIQDAVWLKTSSFKAVFDTINAVYHDKPLIFIGADKNQRLVMIKSIYHVQYRMLFDKFDSFFACLLPTNRRTTSPNLYWSFLLYFLYLKVINDHIPKYININKIIKNLLERFWKFRHKIFISVNLTHLTVKDSISKCLGKRLIIF